MTRDSRRKRGFALAFKALKQYYNEVVVRFLASRESEPLYTTMGARGVATESWNGRFSWSLTSEKKGQRSSCSGNALEKEGPE